MQKIIVILGLLLLGCTRNDDEAILWINEHPKPITVIELSKSYEGNARQYLFQDADGVVAYFKYIDANYPDTIH